MKAHLLFENRDLNTGQPLPSNAAELIQDLELTTLFGAMASDDKFLYEIATRVVLSSLSEPTEIVYRQQVLDDCIAQPQLVREMYTLAVDAITAERKIYRSSYGGPSSILRRSIEVLEMFVGFLRRLRQIAEDHSNSFPSKGLTAFFDTVKTNLDDRYFAAVAEHLQRLKFKDGPLMSAEVGPGIKGDRYVLYMPRAMKQPWRERIGMAPRSVYSFEIHPRDEAGSRALAELNNRGLNLVANALAQSTDHILSFFSMLAAEVGFYVSCLNLHDRLTGKDEPVCMPVPLPWGPPAHRFDALYDVCLTLRTDTRVVGNTANAGGKPLVMVTGANSGGKSTFLRSVGLGQLMMQAGMNVGAESFRANVCDGLFTHFIREEDASMASGKLDEELARMNQIAETLTPRSVVLFNESFAATNEREGSEIARQIVTALLGAGIKVFFVTHQFTLADGFYNSHPGTALFLRAERQPDGQRSFKLVEREALPTSYGEDLYHRVGGWRTTVPPQTAPAVGGRPGPDGHDDPSRNRSAAAGRQPPSPIRRPGGTKPRPI